jgi:predicted ribosomally synthesized peptide with SipW-like signal peptide
MLKKYGKYFVLTALVAAVAVSGVSAYFTANDTATNNFTVNKVDVDLTEPEWDKVVDPDNDPNTPEVPVTVTPNQTILKDPTVTNKGNVDQFVFLKVTVPFQNIVTAQPNGTKNAQANTELFTWNADAAGEMNVVASDGYEGKALGDVNDGWTLIQRKVVDTNVEYIYAYGSATEMTSLAKDASTVALFDSVTMCNAIEGQGLELSTVAVDIDVYAIQASDLTDLDTKVPAQVLEIYLNQNAD